ncbi:hypothetical protein Ocin01_06431 [Orchesella cincta]|uniref:Secreted protein n=1 Tax=Orchesella cincta TaxID=48709 RepID=A0A1D2N5K8_ORCCI|nr:hypothetical protein Ocin01_06431 [Orchesella cincta]
MKSLTKSILVLTLAILSFNEWTAESVLIPQLSEFPHYFEDTPDSFQRISNEYYPEPSGLNQEENEYDEEPTASLFPQLNWDQQRRVRQKNCRWTGCHKLPVGKGNSCAQGTFVESYKNCPPKGSSSVNIQCCS